MTSTTKTEHYGKQPGTNQAADHCPMCRTRLDAGSTPAHSIVLCARCCAALLWDGSYSVVTAEHIERLPPRDRARLHTLAALQRARLASRGALN